MANCALCSAELKFINTPTFGSGKLSDGKRVCTNCFKKINKANPSIAFKLKNYSSNQVESLIKEKENSELEQNSRLYEIKIQLKNLNIDNIPTFLGRKEINELPSILAINEEVDNIIQGTYNNGNGILISTNRRLIFIDKGVLYGLKVEDFPLDKITSIQYETGLLLGKVKIFTSGNIASIENVEKTSSRKFAEFVRDKLSNPRAESSTQSTPNILEQIEKLAKLKDMGILDDAEFKEQKKRLLEKL